MTFWYRISNSWNTDRILISPIRIRADDENEPRDLKPAIAVCPSIAQCLIAIGSWYDYSKLRVYKTYGLPEPATWVFDFKLTGENRFYQSQQFEFVKEYSVYDLIKAGIPVLDLCGVSDEKILKNAEKILKIARTIL